MLAQMPKVATYKGERVFHAESNVVNCRFDINALCNTIKKECDQADALTAMFLAIDKNGVCVEVMDYTGVYPADSPKRVLVGNKKIDIAHHIYHMKIVRAVYMGIVYCRMVCAARGCRELNEVFSSFKLHAPCYYGHNYLLECIEVKDLLEFLDYDKEVYPVMDNQDIRDDVAEILDVAIDEPDAQAEMFIKVLYKSDFQFGLVSCDYLKYAAMTLAQRNCLHVFNMYVAALDLHVKKSFVEHKDEVDEKKVLANIQDFQRRNPHINDCFTRLFPNSVIVECQSTSK